MTTGSTALKSNETRLRCLKRKRFDKHIDQRRVKQSLTKFMAGTIIKMVQNSNSITV